MEGDLQGSCLGEDQLPAGHLPACWVWDLGTDREQERFSVTSNDSGNKYTITLGANLSCPTSYCDLLFGWKQLQGESLVGSRVVLPPTPGWERASS